MPRIRHGFGWNTSEAAVQALVNDGSADSEHTDVVSDNDEDGVDAEADDGSSNGETMRDCLTELIIQRLSSNVTDSQHGKSKPGNSRRNKSHTPRNGGSSDMMAGAEDLSEFIEFLADEIFAALPTELQSLSARSVAERPKLAERYGDPLPSDTLRALVATAPAELKNELKNCGALKEGPRDADGDLKFFLEELYSAYVVRVTTTPAQGDETELHAGAAKITACELCERDWVPLTVHHLIPREIWAKAVKRGWISSETEAHRRLAWLCRACHNCVHRSASNLELARSLNTIEALWERQDIRDFAAWVGKVRWKKR